MCFCKFFYHLSHDRFSWFSKLFNIAFHTDRPGPKHTELRLQFRLYSSSLWRVLSSTFLPSLFLFLFIFSPLFFLPPSSFLPSSFFPLSLLPFLACSLSRWDCCNFFKYVLFIFLNIWLLTSGQRFLKIFLSIEKYI